MNTSNPASPRSLDKAWGEYVTAHPWINQPGYVPPTLKAGYNEWLLSCGYTPLAPRASGETYTNVVSTGQYDYDGNLPDLTLMEVARAFGIGQPSCPTCPTASSPTDDGDNLPDTPYVTANAAVARYLLHRGVPLQPPFDERTVKRIGDKTGIYAWAFLNPGNTTVTAAWWPSLSQAQRDAIASTFTLWWHAMRRLQRAYVSETYQLMRYKEMVRVKRNTERRVHDTVRYPGEERDSDGNITTCPDEDALAAAGLRYETHYDAQDNLVANGLTDGVTASYGEEAPNVQGHGTFSREYLTERAVRRLAMHGHAQTTASRLDEGQVCWWEVSGGDGEDDALNAAYVEALGVKYAMCRAWRCGSNHNHKDGMRRCMAIIEWARRLFGNYVAEELLDYFDTALDGKQGQNRLAFYRPEAAVEELPAA